MNAKRYIYFLLTCGFICSFFCGVKAQGEGATTFKDGITIAITSKSDPPISNEKPLSPDDPPEFSTGDMADATNGRHLIHRVMTDLKNKLYFGYDLEVSAAENNKFRIAFKPLSIDPKVLTKIDNLQAFTIKKFPDEMLVNDGDIISFNTLENPTTRRKFSDLIKVTNRHDDFGNYFTELQPARDFSIEDVEMKFLGFQVYINDQKIANNVEVAGHNVAFYFPGKGQFILSLFPKPGANFQKIGLAEDNKLTFTYRGDTYKFTTNSPIVETGGKWNIWVMYNPNYKPRDGGGYKVSSGPLDWLINQTPPKKQPQN